MRVEILSGNPAMMVMKNKLQSRNFISNMQSFPQVELQNKVLLEGLLNRRWLLPSPESKINEILLMEKKRPDKAVIPLFYFSSNSRPSLGHNLTEKRGKDRFFYVVRDDLLHPLINGNKARKLDALLPLVEDHAMTDVVTCGGCQSAHTAAVAVSCAERGLRTHLLLRGEQPEISTGYNLVSTMYGRVTYISRSVYAKREEMLLRHAESIAGASCSVIWLSDIQDKSFSTQISENLPTESGAKKVIMVNEGAGEAVGLLGLIRLVEHLSQDHIFGKSLPLKIVVDAGTGTTAVGLALGALCLQLSWEVTAVMLADTIEGYKRQEQHLISEFKRLYGLEYLTVNGVAGGIVQWVQRIYPRKFGNVLEGEVEACQQIARQTGILVDPIYTLAAWEQATLLCQEEVERGVKVVMLHTGGTLGMFGLAQRYKTHFHVK
ncbi:D-cysteine desulfhydrase 2, mitochondrial isoform X2 [Aristolochia californica]|uniref:D-cysteine desulfhydrase 2, mitochondrial isoform X2 n=1 Tax=Aristolochia californica TaxID=171875 RepID=UPI0035E033BE